MKPRFEPDRDPAVNPTQATHVDPETYDASEQHFAANLEERPVRSRFVVDEPAEAHWKNSEPGKGVAQARAVADHDQATTRSAGLHETTSRIDESPVQASDSWRQEVQARITHYRARKRPRPPRYPSLQLKFASSEPSWNNSATTGQLAAAALPSRNALAVQDIAPKSTSAAESTVAASSVAPEETGKLLKFPRASAPPSPPRDELAEPVFDQPRILEVPEVLPPPPALGGILIEPTEEATNERRPGFELPLQAAPMSRRVLASAVDSLLVIVAVGLFAYTFVRITSHLPPPRQIVFICAAVTAAFWAGYQYLLLVYAGTTPGLKLARLRLSRFDGRPVPQSLRRWRALASMLAGFSLALGYAWCFFDEDQLCWHDRITHTYIAPEVPK
jgi:uncharacterized RDD family membrane protein YckC